jgi:CRISPR/Cas system Type II protein with McrA/HNH and RuvC-like nuclease domain
MVETIGYVPKTRKELRAMLAEKQRWKCAYCGEQMVKKKGSLRQYTLEHRIPVSRGGTTTFQNTIAVCRQCNKEKGATIPKDEGVADRTEQKAGAQLGTLRDMLLRQAHVGTLTRLGRMMIDTGSQLLDEAEKRARD